MTKLFLSLILFSTSCHALDVVNRWVIPSRERDRIELLPQERTKPILVGDILYYGNLSGEVAAVNRVDGYKFWSVKMPGQINGALTYGRSRLYAGDLQGNLTALHARDGSQAWQVKGPVEWLSQPAVAKNLVFAFNAAEELYAFSESTGKEVWHFAQRGDEKMTIRGTSGPLVHSDLVYQGFADGSLIAFSAPDGREVWNRRLRTKSRFYDVDMVPVIDGTTLYAATYDGKLYALNKDSGETRWIYPAGSYGGFYVEGNRLYLAALGGMVHCLNKDTGEVIWKTQLEQGAVGLSPVKVGDAILVTTSTDPTYLLSAGSGKVLWQRNLGAGTLAAPVASSSENLFFVMSNYGNLSAFEVLPLVNRPVERNTIRVLSAIHRDRS